MDKKEAKRLFLLKQLEDPNISEFEKKGIRDINTVYSIDKYIENYIINN